MLTAFFALAFSLQGTAQCIANVNVETADGFSSYMFCKDGQDDLITFRPVRPGNSYGYVVVNTGNNRVVISTSSSTIDFDQLIPGTYEVFGVSYGGTLNAPGAIFDHRNLATICSCPSPNSITVMVVKPVAGNIAAVGGGSEIDVCVGPFTNSTVRFTRSSIDQTSNFVYLVTDQFGVIVQVSASPVITFNNAGEGELRVYGFAYTGDLAIGPNSDLDWAMSTACSQVSSSFVRVNRTFTNISGGTISAVGGGNVVYTCPGDGIADGVFSTLTGSRGNVVYFATTPSGFILGVSTNGGFNFENAGVGNCRVYAVAYEGEVVAGFGDNIFSSQLATGCVDFANGFVDIIRVDPDAGQVNTVDGTTVEVCVARDGIADIVEVEPVNANTTTPGFLYIVTDDTGRILAVSTNNVFNFDGQGTGVCRIYSIAYTGQYNTSATRITDNLASGCFDLSENFIRVVRNQLFAGSSSPLATTVALKNGVATLGAISGFGSIVPPLFEIAYVLTKGADEELIQVNYEKPLFTVTEPGVYQISAVVGEFNLPYDRNYLNIENFFGESRATIVEFVADNNICAAVGAPATITVVPGTLAGGDGSSNTLAQTIQVAPNPATSNVRLNFALETPENTTTTIDVFDLLGQKVLNVQEAAYVGQNRTELDIDNLNAGAYIIRVSNGSQQSMIKFIKR